MNSFTNNIFQIYKKDTDFYIKLLHSNIDTRAFLMELKKLGIRLHPHFMARLLSAKAGTEFKLESNNNIKALTQSRPFDIVISPDRMRAYLTVNPQSQDSVSHHEILKHLQNAGISFGLDESMIDYAIAKAGNQVIVASGLVPVDGKDAKINYLHKMPEKKPVLCEDGSVNYYELGSIVTIQAGEVLATRQPPTAGEPGMNIFSEVLPAKPGRNYHFDVGKGVIKTGDQAIAEFDGALSWVNGKLMLTRLLVIKGDVDFSVGNICFKGKVVIEGSVRDGFVVEADDDIEVKGGIECARVISNRGSVFVQKGIIGREAGFVQAAKNVEARFIQETNIEAGQNIIINEYTLRSSLKAGDAVLIQGRKGIILGNNEIKARTRIKASNVQNSKSLELQVEGIERKKFHQEIRKLTSSIEKLETELKQTAEEIRLLRDNSSDISSLLKLQKMLPQYINMNEEFDHLCESRKYLVNMLNNTMGEGMIEIGGGLQSGMTLGIKEDCIRLESNVNRIRMYFDPDEKRIRLLE